MILTFVLALFALAFLLHLGKRSKLSAFVLFFGILLVAAAGSGPVTEWTLGTLQTYPSPLKPKWKDSNLIIILGSGQTRWSEDYVSPQIFGTSRMTEGVRLYLECKKTNKVCNIICAGGDPSKVGEAEAVTMSRLLQKLGVAEADILIETESRNTYENAQNVFKNLNGSKFDQTLLVTSSFHMKRSEICFQLNGMTVTPAPSDRLQAYKTLYPHAVNLYYNNLVAHEYAGILKAYFIKTTGLSL